MVAGDVIDAMKMTKFGVVLANALWINMVIPYVLNVNNIDWDMNVYEAGCGYCLGHIAFLNRYILLK